MAFDYSPRRTEAGLFLRMCRFLTRAIIWFLAVSIGLTIVYRFVPPPMTITMLVDEHGFTKDWTPLSRIDRNMVDAVIGGETLLAELRPLPAARPAPPSRPVAGERA